LKSIQADRVYILELTTIELLFTRVTTVEWQKLVAEEPARSSD
jgi:hypothetical protein